MSASLFTIHARFVATDWRELTSRENDGLGPTGACAPPMRARVNRPAAAELTGDITCHPSLERRTDRESVLPACSRRS